MSLIKFFKQLSLICLFIVAGQTFLAGQTVVGPPLVISGSPEPAFAPCSCNLGETPDISTGPGHCSSWCASCSNCSPHSDPSGNSCIYCDPNSASPKNVYNGCWAFDCPDEPNPPPPPPLKPECKSGDTKSDGATCSVCMCLDPTEPNYCVYVEAPDQSPCGGGTWEPSPSPTAPKP